MFFAQMLPGQASSLGVTKLLWLMPGVPTENCQMLSTSARTGTGQTRECASLL